MNILIIEDEPRTAKLLKEIIEELDPSYFVISICESIKDSVKFLAFHQHQLDLIFMDIQLADGTSFEIFKNVEVNTPVIFCTAYDEYSLAAFKNNGIDYILKPFKEEDIILTFNKVRSLEKSFSVNIDLIGHELEQSKAPTSILVKYKDKIYPLNVNKIGCVFLENEVSFAYDFSGHKHPVFKSMNDIFTLLSDKVFFRINRQVIVHRDAVVELEHYFNRKMIVKLKFKTFDKIILGKTKVSTFMEWLEKE